MTCHEARELFSAVVDGALDAREQAAVDAHLSDCTDCRRELDRFRRTVALVEALLPERAPAGFVGRVVTRAQASPEQPVRGQRTQPASPGRRASWPTRLARGLFVPWTTKLPLEAAALLVIAGLAVWIFQRMPEQQRAARLQPPRVETPGRVDAPAPVEAPARTEAQSPGEQSSSQDNASTALAPMPPPTPPGSSDSAANEKKETEQAPTGLPARGSDFQPPRLRQELREAPARDATSPPTAASAMRAPSAPGQADVSGRLTVGNPSDGVTALTEIVNRFGGRVGASRYDGDAHLIELTVPRDRYPDFAREVARLGRWQADADAAELPETVRVRVRLTR